MYKKVIGQVEEELQFFVTILRWRDGFFFLFLNEFSKFGVKYLEE